MKWRGWPNQRTNGALMGIAMAGVLLVVSSSWAQESPILPGVAFARVGPASSAVAVDGVLDESAWDTAVRLSPFVSSPDGSVASVQTQVLACYDAQNLYLAVRCDEPVMARIQAAAAGRDSVQVLDDDRVEVLVGDAKTPDEFFHAAINPRGIVFDERVTRGGAWRDPSWDAKWHWATGAASGGWAVELGIPLADLGIAGEPAGVSIPLNVLRWRAFDRALSGWMRPSHDPVVAPRFGEIELAASTTPIGQVLFPIFQAGENALEVSLQGTEEATPPAQLELQVADARDRVVASVTASNEAAGGPRERSLAARFSIPPGGRYSLAYQVSVDGQPVSRSPRYRFRSGEVEAVVRRINEETNQLRVALRDVEFARALFPRYKDRLDRWESGLAYFNRALWFHATVRPPGLEEWRALEDDARAWDREITRDLIRARAYQAKLADVKQPEYAVGFADSLTKLDPHQLFDGRIGSQVEIQAARNEAEAFQMVLVPLTSRQITIESMRVTDLRKVGGGRRIGRSNVEICREGYVATRRPDYVVDRIGEWPDPLIPEQAGVLRPDENLPFWVTVRVPADAAPGDYEGEIVIRPKDSHEWRVTVRLHVYSFALPSEPPLRVVASLPPWVVADWEGLPGTDPGTSYSPGATESTAHAFRRYGEALLREGVSPLEAGWWFDTPSEEWKQIVSRTLDEFSGLGLSAYHVGRWDGTSVLPAAELLASLSGGKAPGRPVSLLFRRPKAGDEEEVRARARRVREGSPELATLVVGSPVPELAEDVDIWAVPMDEWSPERVAAAKGAGKSVWWFLDSTVFPPCPNLLVDQAGASARSLGWLAFGNGIGGIMIDGTLGPDRNVGERADFPLFNGANGPGYLLYWGRGLRPISSVRLEVLRDTIEDFSYLTLLRQRLAEARAVSRGAEPTFVAPLEKLLQVPDEMAQSLADYAPDPSIVLSRRKAVAEAIEIVEAYLKQVPTGE